MLNRLQRLFNNSNIEETYVDTEREYQKLITNIAVVTARETGNSASQAAYDMQMYFAKYNR